MPPARHRPSPPLAPAEGSLGAVAAASASDIWAAGWMSRGDRGSLIEHWDGNAWSLASSPNVGFGTSLSGVLAISAIDA